VVSTILRPVNPRENPGIRCTGGWIDLGAGLDGTENLASPPPTGIRSRDRPAGSVSLYGLRCSCRLIAYNLPKYVPRFLPLSDNCPPCWVSNLPVMWRHLSEVRTTQPHRRESQKTRKMYFVFHFSTSSAVFHYNRVRFICAPWGLRASLKSKVFGTKFYYIEEWLFAV
jgi:hypothetical protein